MVTRLAEDYLDQGYIIYLDNFYTSTSLFVHLLERKTLACGTTRKDRRGFPAELKDTQWEKKQREEMFAGYGTRTFYIYNGRTSVLFT